MEMIIATPIMPKKNVFTSDNYSIVCLDSFLLCLCYDFL